MTQTNHRSEAIAAEWEWERRIQDLRAQAVTDPEWSDAGRDLAHWPHGWYIPVAIFAVMIVCLAVLAAREWLAYGGTFMR